MNDNTILAQKRKKEKKKNKKLSTYREKLVLCTYRMLITIKNFDETVFGLKKNTKCQINEKKEKFIPRRWRFRFRQDSLFCETQPDADAQLLRCH